MGYSTQPETWVDVCKVPINGRLSISDSMYFFDYPVIVSLPHAIYSVSVRYQGDDAARIVAAVRVSQDHSVRRAREIGQVMVDFARIAICDRDRAEAEFEKLGNDGMSVYFDALDSTEHAYLITLPQGTVIAITGTGPGDGEYPVYMLASNDSLAAGIEVVFSI